MANILVVDDDPVNRLLLATILEPQGHAVTQADDGGTALAALAEMAADLIIVDLFMPGVDGLEFIKMLRDDERNGDTAVILYTATEGDGLRNLVELYRIDAVLYKPSEPHEVLRVVDSVLR